MRAIYSSGSIYNTVTIKEKTFISGIIYHSIFAYIFYLLGVTELMLFNAFISVPAFILARYIDQRKKYSIAFGIIYTELFVNQALSIIYLGWGFGFQHVLFYSIGLAFFNIHWSKKTRYITLVLIMLSYEGFYLFFKNGQIYTLPDVYRQAFHVFISALTMITIALLIRIYVNAVTKAEAELEKKNEFIKETFGRYLSDNIVNNILETPSGLKLGGENRKVTILMSDIRGFTKISDGLQPEEVITILNNYLETMTEIILKYNGTIDEFIGDAILVIFGAPYSNTDDAERAVACAVEMQRAMSQINFFNKTKGYPEIETGIAVNTGEVVVGNIGSDKRAKYGVVGKDVNLTSRIESYTIGGQILISENTYSECENILTLNDTQKVIPKGLNKPINIFSVVEIKGKYNLALEKKDIKWQALKTPPKIIFGVLRDKDIDDEISIGNVTSISEKYFQLETNTKLEKLDNLRIMLNGNSNDEIYGKVVKLVNSEEQNYIVNVTSAIKIYFKNNKIEIKS